MLIVRWSHKEEIKGVNVAVFDDEEVARSVFTAAAAALDLIATHDPLRLRRIRHDVDRILFTSLPSGADYRHDINACRIEIEIAQKYSALELAMYIVHEAMHARLSHCGIGYDRDELRERVERACARAEVDFASRLPDSAEAISRLNRMIERRWWLPEEVDRRKERDLRAVGVPHIIVDWLVRARRASRLK